MGKPLPRVRMAGRVLDLPANWSLFPSLYTEGRDLRQENGGVPSRNEDRGVWGGWWNLLPQAPRQRPGSVAAQLLKILVNPLSQSDIASARSSHPDGQVGQYLSSLFRKLGNAEHQPLEKGSQCRSMENSSIIHIDPRAPHIGVFLA